MGDEDINNTTPLVATVTNETSQETSMCVVENNTEHVDITAEYNQSISHSASEYSMNDSEDLEENLSSAEKVLEVGNKKIEAAINRICELERN